MDGGIGLTTNALKNQYYVSCGLCGADDCHPIQTIKRHRIVQCQQCECIYTNPRAQWNYRDGSTDFDSKLALYKVFRLPQRRTSAEKYWSQLAYYRQTNRLLDVGSGYGFFLNYAKELGWDPTGVELAADQGAWCQREFGISVETDLSSKALEPGGYDVITMWDVIEHLTDPPNFLRRCHDLLRPGGVILIKTPNADILLQDKPWWLKPYLKLYIHLGYPANPVEHTFHFTFDRLHKLVEEIGFLVVFDETRQKWEEWIVTGHNRPVRWARYLIMRSAYFLQFPYQMVVLAEKPMTQ